MADLLFIASHQALREAEESENEKSIHLAKDAKHVSNSKTIKVRTRFAE